MFTPLRQDWHVIVVIACNLLYVGASCGRHHALLTHSFPLRHQQPKGRLEQAHLFTSIYLLQFFNYWSKCVTVARVGGVEDHNSVLNREKRVAAALKQFHDTAKLV